MRYCWLGSALLLIREWVDYKHAATSTQDEIIHTSRRFPVHGFWRIGHRISPNSFLIWGQDSHALLAVGLQTRGLAGLAPLVFNWTISPQRDAHGIELLCSRRKRNYRRVGITYQIKEVLKALVWSELNVFRDAGSTFTATKVSRPWATKQEMIVWLWPSIAPVMTWILKTKRSYRFVGRMRGWFVFPTYSHVQVMVTIVFFSTSLLFADFSTSAWNCA